MKLEIKHIAPYLPYGLKVKRTNSTLKIRGIVDDLYVFDEETYGNLSSRLSKPILRPLSDLIGEIGLPSDIEDFLRGKGVKRVVDLPYWAIDYLCGSNPNQHHFDVFGLIEQGLAIDINTMQS